MVIRHGKAKSRQKRLLDESDNCGKNLNTEANRSFKSLAIQRKHSITSYRIKKTEITKSKKIQKTTNSIKKVLIFHRAATKQKCVPWARTRRS